MSKIQVYHFHNGTGGGVLSVIRNLLRFSNNPLIENHVIYTINKEIEPVYKPAPIAGAVTEQIFYYSPKWNFYFTCRQLAKLLPNEKAIVIAHDWLELGMMSNLGLQNPVVQFLHGAYDYYYQLATAHAGCVDLFIAVAQNIEKKLVQLMPHRRADIFYLRFPVPSIHYEEKEVSDEINIIFIGRLEAAKGYPLMPVIAKKINEKSSRIHWHIVGSANEAANNTIIWDKNIPVKFYGNKPNNTVLELLKSMQLILLPSLAEGMPVIMIEAMKAGVIPLVNNIDGGIQELVIENETGFKIPGNQVEEYVQTINGLMQDKNKMAQMQNNCVELANSLFEPIVNTRIIEESILQTVYRVNKMKQAQKIYGSRLDAGWIPNWVTKVIRNFFPSNKKIAFIF